MTSASCTAISRATEGPAVIPCTTIDSSTQAIVVHTTSRSSPPDRTPSLTAKDM